MKKLFLVLFTFLVLLLSCDTAPGVTLKDLDKRDSMLLVNFESILEQKMEEAGLPVFNIDSTSFVLNKAEASAVVRRVNILLSSMRKHGFSKDDGHIVFPRGAFDDEFFLSSSQTKYRLISQFEKDRGFLWVHAGVGYPDEDCLVHEMTLHLYVDSEGEGLYGCGWVEGFNTCSLEEVDDSQYLHEITRQALIPANWFIGELEMMTESEEFS